MTKLGKKARKFAKKNLQSVLKQRRKLKSTYKRKPRGKKDAIEDEVVSTTEPSTERNTEDLAVGDLSLDPIFSDNDSDSGDDASDSDGFLPEACENSISANADGSESENDTDKNGGSALLGQNKEIHVELANQTKKLERLMKKDPEFSKFLESHNKDLDQLRSEEMSSDEEGMTGDDDGSNLSKDKVLTSSMIDSWGQVAIGEQSLSVLPSLLNAYRAACHYGSDDVLSYLSIQNSDTFCKILKFMLHESDTIFRRLLGISSSSCKKDSVLELKNTSKWKSVKPLIRSFLSSTLFLLNQVTDSEILAFALTQLRVSTIFFAAFPSLLRRLIKVAVHLWATGGGAVSSSSFLIIRNVSLILNLDTCLIKAYRAFISHCKFVESTNLVHIQFLVDSLVELYSLDIQKSYNKALVSIQQLAKILQQGLKTKKKETVKKIYSWQFVNCMDLWVNFISANIRDHDLQSLLYLMIQVIRGVARLFPGPRYFPLRIKCIQMLNKLSSASRVFIPITSLVLDSLEYKGSGKPGLRRGKAFSISSILKVPKLLLKSQCFQEECIVSAIEMLSMHFAQWSFHVSFPELATIPLVRLKKFLEEVTSDSIRRPVKRLIDQVEKNVDYVHRKRDEVAFSPKDLESVESFVQLNSCNNNAPFTQYYAAILKAKLSPSVITKKSGASQKKSKKRSKKEMHDDKTAAEGDTILDSKADSVVKENVGSADVDVKAKDARKKKKRKTQG